MLFHVCRSEVSPDHWIEFPIICKVQFESDQRSHYVIFAQIPPFYWAFPLPVKRQDVPNTISDDIMTSEILVKTHYKEAMHDASQLSKDFEKIIAGVNKELQARRESLDDRLQKWREVLKKKKQDVHKESEKLEAEEQMCEVKEEELSKILADIKANRETNEIRMNEIDENIKRLKKEEKETRIAHQKKSITCRLKTLSAERSKIIEDDLELSKTKTMCKEISRKNTNQLTELYRTKQDLIKRGLFADLEPKLMIGYFRTVSRCYLEVQL